MRATARCCSSSGTNDNNGTYIVAGCDVLQVIAAKLLQSLASSCQGDSKLAIQHMCNFNAASKGFLPALQACKGLLPVKFGPPATAEAAASFAGGSCAGVDMKLRAAVKFIFCQAWAT
jgi:hypothetical protein